ncbi:MAG: hypothetical protein KAK00_10145 [Nanoarchaeota archaeon]|nr:hypothetical protein [Nanoarchaeota archaeon]
MGKENGVIETGVDKLVELIRAKKRVSIQDAAKQLGVGSIVVEEWADFLEEEGIISIEYKFATPYLVERELSEGEIKDKEKEFHSKKEGFVRKAEIALVLLDREGEDFQKFKNKFEKLKKELGSGLTHVESELKELEKFENLKKNIDKEIMEQEREFQKKIITFENDIEREEKKYKDIISDIDTQEERLDKQRLETLSIRQKELNIKKKLEQFQDNILKINQTIKDDKVSVDNSEKRIKNLKNIAEKIKREVKARRGKAKELTNEGNLHHQKILDLQHIVIEKVTKNKDVITKQIEDGKASTKKFREFFNKKMDMEKLIKKMDMQKDELEEELINLIKKAKAFHLSSQSTALKSHTKELEKTFEDINKKKEKFEQEAIRLGSLLKS